MANSQRRKEYTDRNGNMFIPMNVEGGYWNEHFITTPKLFCIVFMVLSLVILLMTLTSKDVKAGPAQYIIYLGIWFAVSVYLTRFVIFEEKFYYRMYKEMQKYEITTPAVFWEIASIKDTDEGAILTYSDTKIGVLVKVERDTITGKSTEFKETHYDAISEFYRSLVTNKYSFIQMNIMERAGKDPRLNELAKLITKSDNPNISKLMEMEVGHIKNITNTTLYESDYFLIYTEDVSKVDIIIEEVYDSLFLLLDGAYVGFSILGSKDVVDLMKEMYGVNYFNATQASMMMFDRTMNIEPITITGLRWKDGNMQNLNSVEKSKLHNLTSKIMSGAVSIKDISLKQTFYKENKENKIGIDFDDLVDEDIIEMQKEQNEKQENTQEQESKQNEKSVIVHKDKTGLIIKKGKHILKKKITETKETETKETGKLGSADTSLNDNDVLLNTDDDEFIDF